jgi:hypothetical protein
MTDYSHEKRALDAKLDANMAVAKATYNSAVADYTRRKAAIAQAYAQALAELQARFPASPVISHYDRRRRRALRDATAVQARLDAAVERAQIRDDAKPRWINVNEAGTAKKWVRDTSRVDAARKLAQVRYDRDMAKINARLKDDA